MIADHRVALAKEALSPAFEEAVAYTGFALDRFKARTEREGAALAILATYRAGQPGDPVFDRLHDLAAARGIPVISQRAWIERRGGDVRDARWALDPDRPPVGRGGPARMADAQSGRLSSGCRHPVGERPVEDRDAASHRSPVRRGTRAARSHPS